jgi:type II secretory pathway component PulL
MSIYQKIPTINNQFILSIDSKKISTFQVTLPVMSFAKAKKAIPFLLEDNLLDDINELDFFVFKTTSKTLWNVIVLNKKIIKNITTQLKNQTENIQSCIFDFMLLPIKNKKITYIKQDDDIIFRINEHQGGCLNESLFLELYKEEDLELSKKSLNYLINLNLFFNNSFDYLKKWLFHWRLSFILLMASITFLTTHLIIENNQLTHTIEQQKTQNIKVFKKLFPSIKRIVDLEVQIEQQLKGFSRQQQKLNNNFLTKLSHVKNVKNVKILNFKNNHLNIK